MISFKNALACMLVFLPLVLSGCAQYNRPSDIKIQNGDYGLAPTDTDKAEVESFIRGNLVDPNSAMFKIDAPKKYWITDSKGITHFGYFIGVLVNAKNSFGGYTGWQPEGIFYKNGSMTDVTEIDMCSDWACQAHGYVQ
ncbi:hypothetical protein POI25_003917 [Salmonella enterica]|nr:hypothetical protein [Salmonella enterica]ECQ6494582.1 hypothetical protein [Salmonella enterica subsp. houtenae]EAW4387392.1 hypothetical protein [Salmonella enterica]EAX9736499.1 hypothetical protein [Salmonella enterica]EBA6029563.1 hypothetical protein [Salmonella enterica]